VRGVRFSPLGQTYRAAVVTGLLDAIGIRKSYNGTVVLDDVSLTVETSEVLGLVGENGAGKSTLVGVLGGTVRADSGRILLDGRDASIRNTEDADRAGIHVLHQNLALVNRLSVAENLFLGRGFARIGPFTSDRRTRQRAGSALEGIMRVDPATRVQNLSVAQRWMVAVAKVCVGDARLVIMDEPTVALSAAEVETLFALIRRLKERGISVIFVSHRLGEVLDVCDRVAVMREGASQGTFPAATLGHDRLMSLIIGADVSDANPDASDERDSPSGGVRSESASVSGPVSPVMSVRGLYGGPLRGVDLDLHAGEILGIGGLGGSGRTSLLQQMFGVHRPDKGAVYLAGRAAPIDSPIRAIKAGIAYIPEDRRTQGLLEARNLRENAVLSSLSSHRHHRLIPFPSRAHELRSTRRIMGDLRVRARDPHQRISELSGGNQQKILLGRALLISGLKVFMLDEPTKGVDIGARREIYHILRDLAAGGVAVLVVSSDLEELTTLCHRIVVLREGQVSGDLRAPMSEAEVLAYCF
jgi:ribose transport system ATP-binding protein